MSDIYIVMGSEGSYEDYTEWSVCAYYSQDLAAEHARLATESARGASARARAAFTQTGTYDRPVNPYDPDMRVSSDDNTEYDVVRVPIRTELPTPSSQEQSL